MAVTRDGPQNTMTPASHAEWLNDVGVLAGLGRDLFVPSYYQRFLMAASHAVDEVHGMQWTVAGAPDFSVAKLGWSRTFTRLHETNGEGFIAPVGVGHNTNAQSVVWAGNFELIACSATRIFRTLSGGDGYIAANALGRLQLVNGLATTTGVYNYFDGLIHPYVLEYILGAPVLGRSAGGVYRLSTDKEQIVGPWQVLPDAPKGVGSFHPALQPPEMLVGDEIEWVGTKADRISAVGPKALLEHIGWAVTGY